MARSPKEDYTPKEDLSGYTQSITIKEGSKSYKLYYNPTEKDCKKAYRRID